LKNSLKGGITAVALAGVFGMQAASAQSSVTVYGLIDTGVVATSHANGNGNSIVKMPGLTGSFPSRLGFKGTEDLGGGLQSLFVLEEGFAPDTGASGQSRFFGRAAYVGLKNGYGTLMLGRQVNMTYLVTLKSDVLGPNIFSIGNIDTYLPNARSDNAIGYLGTFSGVTIGATYSFGRDTAAASPSPAATGCAGEVAGNPKACRQVTAMLAYDTPGYGASTSYDILYGNTGATGGLTTPDSNDRRVTLNGYFTLANLKFGLGVVDRTTRATTFRTESDLYYFGATYPLSTFVIIDAQVARLNVKNSPNDASMAVARLTYNLSKRTALTSSVGYMKNGGTAAIALDAGGTVGPGLNQAGFFAGVRHLF
jgi:predicted porin